MPRTRRRLFLDDDPERAAHFLGDHPDAVWVQTVPECVAMLAQRWDEVHLDHDLGGEVYVDMDREDCGMEVVRWLARQPRPHLRRSRFTVHSHNMVAAFIMAMQIRAMGYRVEARPFGLEPPESEPRPTSGLARQWERARALILRLRGRQAPDPPEAVAPDPPEDQP
jgi:hypothetical protein